MDPEICDIVENAYSEFIGDLFKPGNTHHQFSAAVLGIRYGEFRQFLKSEAVPKLIYRFKAFQ